MLAEMKKTMFLLIWSAALAGCQTAHHGTNDSVVAPVLSGDTSKDSLTWTFSGPDPDHWRVEQLADSDNTGKKWHREVDLPGNLRTSTPATNGFPSRIVGQDKKKRSVTPYSNIVSTF
jgi:hypothetical protein